MPPLPPPLPPETRTVGQVVAESLKLYGSRFWRALPLGLPIAVADQLAIGGSITTRVLVYVALAPVFTAAYAYACTFFTDDVPPLRTWVRALAVGTAVFLPAAIFLPVFSLLSVLWLALVGLAVPVVMIERSPAADAIERAFRLARADFVHAAGSFATLTIVFGLTGLLLASLLRAQADNTVRVAVFIADLVVSPLIFIGAALVYLDQEARSRIDRGGAVPRG